MKFHHSRKALFALAAASFSGVAAHAQQPTVEFTKDRKISNVAQVKQFEPTTARISSLRLPAGFRISKFAEMYNPRMIKVASDGTV